MVLDYIVAFSEILGAIAVVVTLVYLARQIRESNSYAKANTIHDTNALYVQVFSQLALNSELATIYARALNQEDLDEAEAVRFSAFVNTFFGWYEDVYFQTQTAYFMEEFGGNAEHFIDTIEPYANRLLSTKAGRDWWKADAQHQYSQEFVAVVQERVLKDRPVSDGTRSDA